MTPVYSPSCRANNDSKREYAERKTPVCLKHHVHWTMRCQDALWWARSSPGRLSVGCGTVIRIGQEPHQSIFAIFVLFIIRIIFRFWGQSEGQIRIQGEKLT